MSNISSGQNKFVDIKARKDAQDALSLAHEALKVSRENVNNLQKMEKMLEAHSLASVAANKEVVRMLEESREQTTKQFQNLEITVSSLSVRAKREDEEEKIEAEVRSRMEKDELHKRLQQKNRLAVLGWFFAALSAIAALGSWIDPQPFVHLTTNAKQEINK